MLKSLIKINKGIGSLDLRKNTLGDSGIAELSQTLKYSNSLVSVDFSSNELGPKGGSELFKALAVNESITGVDISSQEGLHRNHVGGRGLKRLVQVLQFNKILSILNLSGNTIKVEGLAYIAEGIKGNYTLESLKVSQNEIQGNPQCVQCLKTMFIESKLKELDISDNPLGNACIEGLALTLGSAATYIKRFYCANIGINCMAISLSIRSAVYGDVVPRHKNEWLFANIAT